ncbi:MAG: diguanylate cyclase [Thiomargarita sp.]|nr:diguanylate cyclase [Thiomargarita sp.]
MAHSRLKKLPHLLCLLDFQGNIKQVNNSAWQPLGIMVEYLLITKFTHWIHPDDFAHTQKALSALFSGKSERVVFESRLRDVKGKYQRFFWVATVSSIEQLIYIAGLKINTPEDSPLPVLSQNSSSKLHDLQSVIWATTSDAILVTDTRLRIVKANPTCASFMGYTSKELIGQSLHHFNSGKQNIVFYQKIKKIMEQQGHWQGCVWQRHKNQAVYTCQLKLKVYDKEAEVAHQYVAILSDKQTRNSVCFDLLTDLPTRQLFHHELHKTLAMAQRHHNFFAILLIGLDNMPLLNAKYGSVVGDQLLCVIGQHLKTSVRDSDRVARYDGDKFSVNLEEIAKPQDASLVAQIILFKLTQAFVLEKQNIASSISIGIVVYPEDATQVDSLLALAEKALQKAQQQGGNQYYFSNPVLQERYR